MIVTLKDITTKITKGTTPTSIGCKFEKSGINFIKSESLVDGKTIDKSKFAFISERTHERLKRSQIEENDILFSMAGMFLGKTGIATAEVVPANTNQAVAIIRVDDTKANYEYVYYYLNQKSVIHTINTTSAQSAQPNINLKQIGKIKINLPNRKKQDQIVSLLSAIDLKISNNVEINDNLLEQIRTLCTAWLSDYKPFDGAVPSDWVETPLSDIAEFVSGYSYKGSELTDSTIAMATIKNFDRKGGFKLDGYKEIIPSSKLKESQHAELFDTLVAHTDLTQNAEVICNAEPVMSKSGYDDIVFSMDLVKVLPKKENVSKFLLAAILQDKKFKAHCLGYVNGTTVLHLSKKALPEYKLFLPSDLSKLRPLDEIVTTLYKQISSNISENTYLEELRVALLPKLMSGELDVSGIDL